MHNHPGETCSPSPDSPSGRFNAHSEGWRAAVGPLCREFSSPAQSNRRPCAMQASFRANPRKGGRFAVARRCGTGVRTGFVRGAWFCSSGKGPLCGVATRKPAGRAAAGDRERPGLGPARLAARDCNGLCGTGGRSQAVSYGSGGLTPSAPGPDLGRQARGAAVPDRNRIGTSSRGVLPRRRSCWSRSTSSRSRGRSCAGAGTALTGSLTVTVETLILGKAVLIASMLPSIDRLPGRPVIRDILWPALRCTSVSLVPRDPERSIGCRRNAADNRRMVRETARPRGPAARVLLIGLILPHKVPRVCA
jgi:hypothetical protein